MKAFSSQLSLFFTFTCALMAGVNCSHERLSEASVLLVLAVINYAMVAARLKEKGAS